MLEIIEHLPYKFFCYSVVIWNMETGEAICGDQAQVKSAGDTLCISFSKKDDNIFVTGGE